MNWTDPVPEIRRLTEQARPHFKLARQLAQDPAFSEVGLELDTGCLYLQKIADPSQTSLDLLWAHLPEISDTPSCRTAFYQIKYASRVSQLTRPLFNFFSSAQKELALGGPNALTTSLVGAGLGSLGGYTVGKVLDHTVTPLLRRIVPRPRGPNGEEQEMIGGSSLAPTLAIAGGALGAAPGIVRGGVAAANGHSPMSAYPWTKEAADFSQYHMNDPTGALFVPSIPVDAFNRAVWADTTPNPFGTKSQWGDNQQPLHTPPEAAAAISGLVGAAGAARGRDMVSPWDIASVATRAAISGGAGALTGAAAGLLAGKLLGALAGLTPAGQQYARQTGQWAGLISGLAAELF